MLTQLGPPLAVLVLAGPILAGLAGTFLPAFGYLPALGGTSASLDAFRALLAEPGLSRSVALSLWTGLLSTLLSLGIVASFVAAWAGTRVFDRLRATISPLLAVPHAAAALGFALLIAPSGMAVRILSPELTGWTTPPDALILNDPWGLALIAGLTVKEVPFLFLVALAALPQVRLAETRAVTASLGYGRIAGFMLGAWPLLYRQLRLAVLAVLVFASSVVDVAVVLGPTAPATLAVRLVDWMGDPDLSMRFQASAGAVLQLAVTGTAIAAWVALERLGRLLLNTASDSGRRLRRDAPARQAALIGMTLTTAFVAGGLAVLALWSLAGQWRFPDAWPESLSLSAWQAAWPGIDGPLATTLVIAAMAAAIAVWLVVLCLAREDETGRRPGRTATTLLYLPLLVPQAAFLFGLQLLMLLGGVVASLPTLAFVHLVFVLPYVFLSLSDPWRAYDRRYDTIAASLGKRRRTILWRVRLPILLPALLTSAAIGFAVSVGLYLPTVLIGAGRVTTVTTEAVALASGGNRRIIGVWAIMSMLLPFAGFGVATLLPLLMRRGWRPRAG